MYLYLNYTFFCFWKMIKHNLRSESARTKWGVVGNRQKSEDPCSFWSVIWFGLVQNTGHELNSEHVEHEQEHEREHHPRQTVAFVVVYIPSGSLYMYVHKYVYVFILKSPLGQLLYRQPTRFLV